MLPAILYVLRATGLNLVMTIWLQFFSPFLLYALQVFYLYIKFVCLPAPLQSNPYMIVLVIFYLWRF